MSPSGAAARGLLVAVLVFLSLGARLPFAGVEALAASGNDDTFYYLQIARNAAQGRGSTFDGIHRTNGYHPAWLALLVPVLGMFPGDVAGLRAVLLLQSLLVALAALLIHAELSRRLVPAAALAGSLLVAATPMGAPALRSGMESALFLLALVLLWRAWNEAVERGRGYGWAGLALGLVCLSRLEAIVGLPLLLAAAARRGAGRPALLALAAPALLLWGGWTLVSALAFGSPLPVSGLVKTVSASYWPLPRRLLLLADLPWPGQMLVNRVSRTGGLLGQPPVLRLVVLALAALTVFLVWRHRRALADAVGKARIGLLLALLAAVALIDRAAVVQLFPWYLVPWLLGQAVLAAALLDRHPRTARLAAAAAVLLLAARVPIELRHDARPERRVASYRLAAARWIDARLPASARIGSWNAGVLGYFSHRPVVNLDGLVNDLDFARRLIERAPLGPYLEREGIGWLADYQCREGPPAGHLLAAGSPGLAREFEVAAGFFNEGNPSGCPGIVVWRRRP